MHRQQRGDVADNKQRENKGNEYADFDYQACVNWGRATDIAVAINIGTTTNGNGYNNRPRNNNKHGTTCKTNNRNDAQIGPQRDNDKDNKLIGDKYTRKATVDNHGGKHYA